ncbi:hypothetical protein Goklo_001334 [Gossypium klotzschianum]|uniref:Uncharacterized protein n=1 Tax=Gossypium klotzschianum TaxID=34286 RepID=A0A7J8W047_9ROSI|nr:hypothetical protein [Gossypium klotzschianum]
MESFEQVKGNGGVIDQTMEDAGATNPRVQWKQMGYEEKTVAVHEEMKRMNRLPATSSYVTHRMRVLNKILQLLSIQVIKYVGLIDFVPMLENYKVEFGSWLDSFVKERDLMIYCLFVYTRELLHKKKSWSCSLLGCPYELAQW